MDFIFKNRTMQKISTFLHYVLIDITDKRTINWPLVRDPTWICLILWLYVSFVTYFGPKLMKNRKPFKLQKILLVYNFIHVLFSVWLFTTALFVAYLSGIYSLKCQPVDWARSYYGMKAARAVYLYFLSKVLELLDTVFFVLRKKDNQISFLHIFHHTVMALVSFGVTKYYPGGNVVFYGVCNLFVHSVMYLYYLIAAMGPKYQKYLWWKKHMTKIQMVQFFVCITHALQLLYTDCGFPRWTLLAILPNCMAFYFLFHDFYQQAYLKAQADKKLRELKKDKITEMSDANGNKLEITEKIPDTSIAETQSVNKGTIFLRRLLFLYLVLMAVFIFGFDQMQPKPMEIVTVQM